MTPEKEEDRVQLQSLTELTIEQQFKLKVYADETHIMSGRLTMIKLLPPATNRNESNH